MKSSDLFKTVFGIHEQNIPRVAKIFEKLLLVFILVLPLQYILRLFFSNTNPQLSTIPGYGMIVALVVSIALIILLLNVASRKSILTKSTEIAVVISICFMAFLLRLITCTLLQTSPVSDFLYCYDYAVSHQYAQYAANVPYSGFYALSIKLFMNIFGQSVFTAQIFGIIVSSLIPAVLYISSKSAFQSVRTGFLSALLFAIFPSMILYASVLSCENIAMFFLAVTVMFLTRAWRRRLEKKKYWILIASAGIALGFMNLYKPLLIFMIAAICIAEFLFFICPAVRECIKAKKFLSRQILYPVLVIAIIYTAGSLTTLAGKSILYWDTGLQPTGSNSFVATAFEGLYSEGGGFSHLKIKKIVLDIKSESDTSAQADKKLLQVLKNDILKDVAAFKILESNKYLADWCSEKDYLYWATTESNSMLDVNRASAYLIALPDMYYIMLVVMISIGVFFRLIRHGKGAYPYILMLSIYLVLACTFILIVAQGRYKSIIMPIFCVLAAVGFIELANIVPITFDAITRFVKCIGIGNKKTG